MQEHSSETPINSAGRMLGKGLGITRRDFLRLAAFATGSVAIGGLAAACAPTPTAVPAAPAATAAPLAPAAAPTTAAAVPPTAVAATAVPTVIKPKVGGTITWALEQDPTSLIPFGATATSNQYGKEPMYESLLAWDKDLNVIPALAEKWETPDDKTWIWHLRQGVKFHDGNEVTADDVKYSIDLQAKPPPPGVNIANYPQIVSTEVVDKYTVKFNMKGPDPTVLGYFAWERYSPIVPKDLYTKVNPNIQGIGTGPYKLVEYVPKDRVVFTRNKNYWRPGLPYADDLFLKILPDESTRIAALRSGAIDGCVLTSDAAQTLKNDPNITVLKGIVSAPRQIQFTIHKGSTMPWAKKGVRQAINMAINRQDIIDKVFGGNAVYCGPIPPGYGDWSISDDELKSKFYKTDVAGAKKLLADNGYPNGFPMTMYTIATAPYPQLTQVLKEQLSQVGINMTIIAEEITSFAKRNGDGSFDVCLTGRGMRADPSGYINEIASLGSSGPWFDNGDGWKNEEAQALYAKLISTVDPAPRHPMVRRIQEIGLDEYPEITLVQDLYFNAVRNYLKGMYVAYTGFYTGLRTAWLDK